MVAAPTPLPAGAWSLQPVPAADGSVRLDVQFGTDDGPTSVSIHLTRDEARNFARATLAAAGDAFERTQGGGR
ncbi:hypothetical protein [Methylobacterium sp. ID0610]|uniref:hypothetical protein n=1 Tax=Methylobacterium carpenticola TaxID=3344827 RepID=UPI00368E645E